MTLKATKKNLSTQNQQQEEAVYVMPVRSGEDPVKEALKLQVRVLGGVLVELDEK